MIDPQRLKDFRESPYVQLIKDYFNEQISKMNDVSTIQGTIEEKGRIVSGRQEAEKILKDFIRILEIKPEKEKIPNQYK